MEDEQITESVLLPAQAQAIKQIGAIVQGLRLQFPFVPGLTDTLLCEQACMIWKKTCKLRRKMSYLIKREAEGSNENKEAIEAVVDDGVRQTPRSAPKPEEAALLKPAAETSPAPLLGAKTFKHGFVLRGSGVPPTMHGNFYAAIGPARSAMRRRGVNDGDYMEVPAMLCSDGVMWLAAQLVDGVTPTLVVT